MLDKLKKMADQAKEKAGPLAEQAKERATVLAAEAKEKAGPLAEQAKGRATELAGKAAPAVSQGIDKAAGSLDKATTRRYTGHIDKVQGVVHDTAQKVGDKAATAGTTTSAGTSGSADLGTPDAVIVDPVPPVVTPAPTSTFDVDPDLASPGATPETHPDKPQA
jgi:vacuolar-type H+-ATPase subunit H